MLNENKLSLLQIENRIKILQYHIELLAKLFPEIIKEYPKIRKSTANEINRTCSELDFIIIEKNNLVNQIKKNEKVNS